MEFIYQQYKPSKTLQSIVDCYWSLQTTGSRHELSPKRRCLPLGMVELIVHIEDNFAHGTVCDRVRIFPEAFLVGIMKEPVCWQMLGNSTAFGVRLKPEGVLQLFRTPLAGLCNDFVDVESFLEKAHMPVIEKIQEAADHQSRISLTETFLHNQLAKSNSEENHFTEALKQIRSKECRFTHTLLAKKLQVGERQLQRMFKDNLGLSPKSYFRIMRFRSAIDSVNAQKKK